MVIKLLCIYENETMQDSPFWQPPFIPIYNMIYLPRVVPWMVYPHFHKAEHELSYIASGKGFLNLPGKLLPLEPGSVTLVPANTAHCFLEKKDSPLKYYTIRFRSDGPETPLLSQLESLGTCTVSSPDTVSLCASLLSSLLPRLMKRNCRSSPVIQTAGLMLLNLSAEELASAGHSIALSCPPYVNDILLYLQAHTGKRITMEDVAQHFHLSQAHIFRVFRETYHISPMNYLIYCRMREARALLLKYHMSRDELARRLAYKNVYYFVDTFQRFFSCTPEMYYLQETQQKAGN